jgi:hypothetical protein
VEAKIGPKFKDHARLNLLRNLQVERAIDDAD